MRRFFQLPIALVLSLALCSNAYAKNGSDDGSSGHSGKGRGSDDVYESGPRVTSSPEIEHGIEHELEHDVIFGDDQSCASVSPTASPTVSPTVSPTAIPALLPLSSTNHITNHPEHGIEVGDDKGHHGSEIGDDKGVHSSPSVTPSPNATQSVKNNSSGEQRFRARLLSLKSNNVSASGKVDVENKVKSKRTESRFQGNVHVAAPAPTDLTKIALSLSLSRAGVAYASCPLALERLATVGTKETGEFKIDLRSRSDRKTRASRGDCDINLNTVGIQSGIPAVQADDTVDVKDGAGLSYASGIIRTK